MSRSRSWLLTALSSSCSSLFFLRRSPPGRFGTTVTVSTSCCTGDSALRFFLRLFFGETSGVPLACSPTATSDSLRQAIAATCVPPSGTARLLPAPSPSDDGATSAPHPGSTFSSHRFTFSFVPLDGTGADRGKPATLGCAGPGLLHLF
jgi:hypothetical protein